MNFPLPIVLVNLLVDELVDTSRFPVIILLIIPNIPIIITTNMQDIFQKLQCIVPPIIIIKDITALHDAILSRDNPAKVHTYWTMEQTRLSAGTIGEIQH